MNVVRAEALPQRTSIGHEPVVVLVPTVQLHDTFPLVSADFGPRPWAELGPLLYVTVIEQETDGSVVTETLAVPPRETGVRTETKRTNELVAGVAGMTNGLAVGVDALRVES